MAGQLVRRTEGLLLLYDRRTDDVAGPHQKSLSGTFKGLMGVSELSRRTDIHWVNLIAGVA